MLYYFQQIDDDSFENIFLTLNVEDQLNLRLLSQEIDRRCLVAWKRVRSLKLKYAGEIGLSSSVVNYIIDLTGHPYSFTYCIFKFMRNLTSLIIDNSMFVRLSLRDREYSSDMILRTLKGCPKINSLSCIGVPITTQIVSRLMIKRRLRSLCFDTVKEDAVCLVLKLLKCSTCLSSLSIPRFMVVSANMRLPDMMKVCDLPVVSVCLRSLNVGGLVGLDLGKLLGLNVTTYIYRSRSGRMLEIANQQLHILLNFRQITRLHLPYSNINSDNLI